MDKEISNIYYTICECGWKDTDISGVFNKDKYSLIIYVTNEIAVIIFRDEQGLMAKFEIPYRKIHMVKQLIKDWTPNSHLWGLNTVK